LESRSLQLRLPLKVLMAPNLQLTGNCFVSSHVECVCVCVCVCVGVCSEYVSPCIMSVPHPSAADHTTVLSSFAPTSPLTHTEFKTSSGANVQSLQLSVVREIACVILSVADLCAVQMLTDYCVICVHLCMRVSLSLWLSVCVSVNAEEMRHHQHLPARIKRGEKNREGREPCGLCSREAIRCVRACVSACVVYVCVSMWIYVGCLKRLFQKIGSRTSVLDQPQNHALLLSLLLASHTYTSPPLPSVS
jgi:hypothetical protein